MLASSLKHSIPPELLSAGDHVHRETALASFLVTLTHIVPGLAHCLDTSVKRHKMLAVAFYSERSSSHSLNSAKRVTLDTWYLNQPGNRVARHAEMVFQSDFGRIFNLLGRSTKHSCETGCGQADADPTSP